MHSWRFIIVAFLCFAAYFTGAILFRQERIFLDGSYYFFHVVQSENFWVEHQRFILIVSQLLAWTGVQLNLSLETVLLLNSLNPVIYLLFIFIVCVFVFKDKAAGWAVMLLGVCGVYFLYFVPMYEVWYGAVLLILFATMLRHEFYHSTWQLIVLGVTAITLLFSYPLMIVGFLYFSILHFLKAGRISIPVAGIFFLIFCIWGACKIFFLSEYETGKVSYPYSRIGTTLSENFQSFENFKSLLWFLFTVYAEAMVMLTLTIAMLLKKGKFGQVVILLTFCTGYILLINVTHSNPWHHSNYFERMYLVLIPMCMLPFLTEVYSCSPHKRIFEVAFICLILFRGYGIVQHTERYASRIEKVRLFVATAQQQVGSKFFVKGEDYPGDPALDEWSFPMEALLFSSLNNSQRTVTISLKSDLEAGDVQPFLNEHTFRLRLNEIREDTWLNPSYFRLQQGSYTELNKQ